MKHLSLISSGTRGIHMKGIIIAVIAIGALWVAAAVLNDGRYGDVAERGLFALVGR
jgi:hypothetical protein